MPSLSPRWSTTPSDYPGVERRWNRWRARVPYNGSWLYIGPCDSQCEAGRLSRHARELTRDQLAQLAACPARGRRAMLEAMRG